VILMSDGLANTGITAPGEISRLVADARRKGIRISAMGLGRDYDEDLMQAIAENGGGRYYYIEHPSQMARIFQDELGSLFETCARDISLEFIASGAVRNVEIVGYDEAQQGTTIRHGLEDVYAGEKRSVLLRLDVDAPASGTLDLGRLALRYRAAASGESSSFAHKLGVSISSDASAVTRSQNRSVTAEAALAESDRVQKEQVRLYQQGRHEEARRNLKALATDLEIRNRDLADERLTRKIEALTVEQRQMESVAASPAEQKAYLKASKQRLYQAKSGKRTGFALQQGDKGREVTRLQEALQAAGSYTGPIDGIYDDDVAKAVAAYQKANGIKADGIAGATTMDRMGLY
jgi:Ca-activated chloride channel family protein